MANTTFIDNQTVVPASWLNDVNDAVYDILGDGTSIPASKAALKTNLALNNVDNTSDANKPISTATQTALDGKVPQTSATGSAVIPNGTTAQRDGSPLAGYFRFNQTLLKFEGYNGTAWGAVGGGATGGGGDEVFVENTRTVTTSYTLPALRNAHSVGPITINDGVVVTIPDGCRWVVS